MKLQSNLDYILLDRIKKSNDKQSLEAIRLFREEITKINNNFWIWLLEEAEESQLEKWIKKIKKMMNNDLS